MKSCCPSFLCKRPATRSIFPTEPSHTVSALPAVPPYVSRQILPTIPEALPQEDAYQEILKLMAEKCHASQKNIAKIILEDKREVLLLGTLCKKTEAFLEIYADLKESHFDGFEMVFKELIRNIYQELRRLQVNLDLETDELVSKELSVLKEILVKMNPIYEEFRQLDQQSSPVALADQIRESLTEVYSQSSSLVHVHFDGSYEAYQRMALALNNTDSYVLVDSNEEETSSKASLTKIPKRDFLKQKTIYVQKCYSWMSLSLEFRDLFPPLDKPPEVLSALQGSWENLQIAGFFVLKKCCPFWVNIPAFTSSSYYLSQPHSEEMQVLAIKESKGTQAALEKILSFPRKGWDTKAAAAVVIDEQGTVTQAYRGKSEGHSIGAQSYFNITSLSEFLTGITVYQLLGSEYVDQSGNFKIFSLETVLVDILSAIELEKVFNEDAEKAASISLQHLVTHCSGVRAEKQEGPELKSNILNSAAEKRQPTANGLLKACEAGLKLKLIADPEKAPFHYSHFNVVLVALMLERVCSRPFQEIMQKKLFKPYGLLNTAYRIPLQQQRASGYQLSGRAFAKDSCTNAYFFETSNHIWSTAEDLTYLFQKLNEDQAYYQWMKDQVSQKNGQRYCALVKVNSEGYLMTWGQEGGCEGFRTMLQCDNKGRVALYLENQELVAEDTLSRLLTVLLGMKAFHGGSID